MAKPMFFYTGVYDNVADADADYEAIKSLYKGKAIGSYDSAIVFHTPADGVKVTKTEKPTQKGGWIGLAAGAGVAVVFPFLLPAVSYAGMAGAGAGLGAWFGHLAHGTSRGDAMASADLPGDGRARGIDRCYAAEQDSAAEATGLSRRPRAPQRAAAAVAAVPGRGMRPERHRGRVQRPAVRASRSGETRNSNRDTTISGRHGMTPNRLEIPAHRGLPRSRPDDRSPQIPSVPRGFGQRIARHRPMGGGQSGHEPMTGTTPIVATAPADRAPPAPSSLIAKVQRLEQQLWGGVLSAVVPRPGPQREGRASAARWPDDADLIGERREPPRQDTSSRATCRALRTRGSQP